MKLRHKSVRKDVHIGKRVAGFVGVAVLAAGLAFSGCDKRGGLTPAPEPNNRQIAEARQCGKIVTGSESGKRLLEKVHQSTLILNMSDAIRAEPGETVGITWRLRVEDNGNVDLVGVEASCDSGNCSGLDPARIKSSLPPMKVEAPADECGCRWDIRTIIESQRS